MNIAQRLRRISEAPEAERESLVEEFRVFIIGHPEEAILTRCLKEAIEGETRAILGKKTLPPAELKSEGLEFKMFWSQVVACW